MYCTLHISIRTITDYFLRKHWSFLPYNGQSFCEVRISVNSLITCLQKLRRTPSKSVRTYHLLRVTYEVFIGGVGVTSVCPSIHALVSAVKPLVALLWNSVQEDFTKIYRTGRSCVKMVSVTLTLYLTWENICTYLTIFRDRPGINSADAYLHVKPLGYWVYHENWYKEGHIKGINEI